MIKKTTLVLAVLFTTTGIFAQQQTPTITAPSTTTTAPTTTSDQTPTQKAKQKIAQTGSRDRLVFDLLSYNNWLTKGLPAGLTKGFGAGFNFYFYYDFIIKKSNFSFAPGIGFSYADVNTTQQLLKRGDSTSIPGYTYANINPATGLPYYDKTTFVPFTPTSISDRTIKKYMLSTLYLDIPLELRWRSKPDKHNCRIKVAVGWKTGVLVDDHTKETDTGPDGHHEVIKVKNYYDLDKLHYGPTFRIGYGPFNVFANYSVGPLFTDSGPQTINTYQVGISINGL